MFPGLNQGYLKFTPAQPPVQGWEFIGPVTGPVLIHEIEVGIRGYFLGDERENLVGTG